MFFIFWELIYSNLYFNLAEIFVLRILKTVVNQAECSRFEQTSINKFLMTEKSKSIKIIEERVVSTGKHVLIKKCLQIS